MTKTPLPLTLHHLVCHVFFSSPHFLPVVQPPPPTFCYLPHENGEAHDSCQTQNSHDGQERHQEGLRISKVEVVFKRQRRQSDEGSDSLDRKRRNCEETVVIKTDTHFRAVFLSDSSKHKTVLVHHHVGAKFTL